MSRAPLAEPMLATLLLAACSSSHSGFPSDQCTSDCLTGGETLFIMPSQSVLLVGSERALRATLMAADGTQRDVSDVAVWSISDVGIATVSDDGLVTGISPGQAIVRASLQTLDAQASVQVTALRVEEILVSPAYSRLLPGLSQQYTATAVLTDGQTVDISPAVDWSVGNGMVAEIDAHGLARAIGEGLTLVNARYSQGGSALTASATLAVHSPAVTIESFTIEPASATTVPGAQVAYRAFVVTSENEVLDVSADVVWESSNPAVAQIDPTGVATAQAAGDTQIRANLTYRAQPYTATSDLTVVAPEVAKLRVAPHWSEVLVGQQQAYQATAVLASGLAVDVTRRVLWRSLTPAVAAVDQAGTATGLAAGTATIAASLTTQGVNHQDFALLVVSEPPPVPLSLSIVPPDASVLVDDTLQYRCFAAYSDGSVHEVTGECLWSVADPTIAVIDGLGGLLTGVAAGGTQVEARFILAGASVSAATPVQVVSPVTVAALQITPAAAESVILGTQQFLAHALLTDGRKIDVTDNVAWSSDDPGIATVSTLGLARARAPGQTQIRASANYQGKTLSDAASFTVAAPAVTVEEFRVVPPRQITHTGGTVQFDAELLLSDGQTLRVTEAVDWTASDGTVAQSTATKGEFVGLRSGATRAQAAFTYQGASYSSSAGLMVVDPGSNIVGLEIEPASPLLLAGGQRQLRSLLLLNNGAFVDVTHRSQWTSADEGIATVSAQGIATGVAAGLTTVTSTVVAGSVRETATATTRVLDPATQLVAMRVAPVQAAALIGTDTRFTATAYYLDGSRTDVSGEVSWVVADTSVATLISQDGLVRATGEGTTAVSAHYHAGGSVRTDSGTLQVAAPAITITELQVTPARQSVAAGNTAQFSATAILSDDSHVDVSADVQWRSGAPSIARATTPPGAFQTFTPGSTTISATLSYEGQRYVGESNLIVRSAQPTYLEISPPLLRLATGERSRLHAILHSSDNSTEDVTREVWWRSEQPAIATVNSSLRKGLVTGVSPGATAITAVYRGSFSASAAVQVTAPVLSSIDVLPALSRVAAGLTQSFTAIGNYSDGSALDITDRALWSSSDETVAAVVPGDRQGLVRGVAAGSATISAALDGIAGRASLTVTPAVVVALVVGPHTARIRVDDEQAFIAIAVLSDGSRREVTNEATWTSSNRRVASVSNRRGSAGVAQGLAEGSTQIRAAYRGLRQDSALQVVAPIIDAIVVTPANGSVTVGSNVYYTASAVLADSTQLDVTRLVTWTSSDPNTAAISNGRHKGRATGLSPGRTTITATLGTFSGQTRLTVTRTCRGRPDSIFIVSDVTIHVGETAQMQVTGIYPDGCTQDLTEDLATVWDSSDNDVFTIRHKSGVVTGVGPGSAQAEVRNGFNTDEATVTVLP